LIYQHFCIRWILPW